MQEYSNEERSVWDEIVITKYDIFPPLLEIIRDNPKISQNKLKIKSRYSGGKIYHSVKALKSMKLISNGDGLSITEAGIKFLNKYKENGKFSSEELKEACLNVPLFQKIYKNNPEVNEPKKLFELFSKEIKEIYPNINERLIGSTIRRYLFGVFGVKLRSGARTGSKSSRYENQIKNKNTPEDKVFTNDITTLLKQLKENLNLNDNEIYKIINVLPDNKREQVLSQLFSKALK